MIKRHFELKLSYRMDGEFDVRASDVIIADNLVSLLSQFNVLIASTHQRILLEERTHQMMQSKGLNDDDIPF